MSSKGKKNGLGGALKKAARSGNRHNPRYYDPNAASRHTTDFEQEQERLEREGTMQSKVEHSNDLEEFLFKAEMAHTDFAAERSAPVVVSVNGKAVAQKKMTEEEILAAQAEHESRIRVPRRPQWTTDMTKEQLNRNEKESFLDWRRELATVEDDSRLILTPFEKNLEVWRQLWRVIERSDLVVQVLDSRDPLFYLCEDLNAYVKEVDQGKRSMVLMNKADFLPEWLRVQWADYFDSKNISYLFWSAKAELQLQQEEKDEEDHQPVVTAHSRTDVLGQEQVLAVLEEMAAAATSEKRSGNDRTTVGFVGYPNVGKSSTLNALIGEKKASVAATPGKTKHFQTMNVSETLCLCDCPGLVFPQFSSSKADMAAAGVLPIERLTDIRDPISKVAERSTFEYLEELYSLKLPRPPAHEPFDRPVTAAELLRSYAASRNYISSSGLPDETRAGRQILKDYRDGKLCCCRLPPNKDKEPSMWTYQDFYCPTERNGKAEEQSKSDPSSSGKNTVTLVDAKGRKHNISEEGVLNVGALEVMDFVDLDDLPVGGLEIGDEDEEESQEGGPSYSYRVRGRGGEGKTGSAVRGQGFTEQQKEKGKQVRAEHKFNMKLRKTKGTRGQNKAMGMDGGMMQMGKKGGLKPMSQQMLQG